MPLSITSAPSLDGTPAQVEWAERIRTAVNADFDRVASLIRAVGARQHGDRRASNDAILGILEDQRTNVMNRNQAGYFIQEWQEIGDRVRLLILRDPRYPAFAANRRVQKLETAAS